MTQPLTYVSLFSGVGGFDLGMDRAGWECVAQVEWDKHCQPILARHWPTVPRWSDVCDVSGHELPPADAVIFGSPCQDLSIAGKRAGIAEGTRSGLFFEAVRIIREMREATNHAYPRVAIWENVAGALSSNGGADFGVVIDALADAGALAIEWAVLDAQHFGVPQRRRRVFLVAIFDPRAAEHCPEPLLPVVEGSSRDSASRRTAQQNDSQPAADCTGAGGGIVAALTANGVGTCGVDDNQAQARHLVVEPIAFSHDQGLDIQPSTVAFPTLRVGGTGHAVAFAENQRGELRESDVALSLSTGGGKPGVGYPSVRVDSIVRRLTPLECERLMGWPDHHTRWRADGTEQADSHRYRQCGNGVASPVATWVGRHVAALLHASME